MEMIAQLEEEKKNMVQANIECATMIREDITSQELEVLTKKAVQIHERGRELVDKFHSLAEVFEAGHTA
jgi:hypothetical protein